MAAKKKSGKRPPRSIYLAIGADMDLDGASH